MFLGLQLIDLIEKSRLEKYSMSGYADIWSAYSIESTLSGFETITYTGGFTQKSRIDAANRDLPTDR